MQSQQTKSMLHPRNQHREGYNFDSLVEAHAPLKPFVMLNKFGSRSINFFDPTAVRTLNAALLALHYNIGWWSIPPESLTPPIPGRADYIHHIADLIGSEKRARCLDIGTGASCIYPLIGHAEYGWEFVGSDISQGSIDNARQIIEHNPSLRGHIELRQQNDPKKIFEGIIDPTDRFDVTLCNPPFHDSKESAERSAERKLRGLSTKRGDAKRGGAKREWGGVLNFSGQSNELWCKGGEREFVKNMILESKSYALQCGWFTSLISNEDNLATLRRTLGKVGVREHRTIEMSQGNKRSRILAWRY